ncbi:toxin of addiction system [Gulbenkiania mobilis]|uniref:toxin of addiction system n=1 Tax=Gulbenkiania mobilis TaxID=397457 RepID=UPI00128F8C1C|nr:toxin of addiction system [Gulbenkiania mobilis]
MHTPQVGDVVRAWFPEWPSTRPGPKARPCLVIDVEHHEHGTFVLLAYGTSQRTNALFRGEFTVQAAEKAGWKACSDKATKFSFANTVKVPVNERWILDRVGHLRVPALMRRMQAAYTELQKP